MCQPLHTQPNTSQAPRLRFPLNTQTAQRCPHTPTAGPPDRGNPVTTRGRTPSGPGFYAHSAAASRRVLDDWHPVKSSPLEESRGERSGHGCHPNLPIPRPSACIFQFNCGNCARSMFFIHMHHGFDCDAPTKASAPSFGCHQHKLALLRILRHTKNGSYCCLPCELVRLSGTHCCKGPPVLGSPRTHGVGAVRSALTIGGWRAGTVLRW